MTERKKLLIEDWFPMGSVGVEARRERSASSALPPMFFLHVWWSRKPLVVARATVLGSLLPAWSRDWPDVLLERFPDAGSFRDWFVGFLGVRGDPVAREVLLRVAREEGRRLDFAFEGPRAFTVGPEKADLVLAQRLFGFVWGDRKPMVFDSTAGGGAIPLESLRFGCRVGANELSSVASVVLQGTLLFPARHGLPLVEKLEKWGGVWVDRIKGRLGKFFPSGVGEEVLTYLWSPTVPCPDTGKVTPLQHSWWLSKKDRIAVRVVAEEGMGECGFEIVRGEEIDLSGYDPGVGSVKRGKGVSVWSGGVIEGDYIKHVAQTEGLGEMLFAVAVKTKDGKDFRLPTPEDLAGVVAAEEELGRFRERSDWSEYIPDELIPFGSKTSELLRYGRKMWSDLFSGRQLLSVGVAVEELRGVGSEIREVEGEEMAKAVVTYLGMVVSKMVDFNARSNVWDPNRSVISHVFSQHAFPFRWGFGEMNVVADGLGLDWALRKQVVDAYAKICKLIESSRGTLFPSGVGDWGEDVDVSRGDAGDLRWVERGSVEAVVMDPPYYDNIQYGELSDFFYVWLKRTVGHLYPGWFDSYLGEKDEEAVMNPARFDDIADSPKRRRELARADYERKMVRVFGEAERILRDDGVLTVMFNHKEVEAWDVLARSLIEGGFQVVSSWPVHTESQHSLHQAGKAAVASTIMLACRKREKREKRVDAGVSVWWEEVRDDLAEHVRGLVPRLVDLGISGTDLLVGVFGPALSVVSEKWPVFSGSVDQFGNDQVLSPGEVLDFARGVVIDTLRTGLLSGCGLSVDGLSDWYLMAWELFGGRVFPFDEARKLALSFGVEVRELQRAKLVGRKQGRLVLWEPGQRREAKVFKLEDREFKFLVDRAHLLMSVALSDRFSGVKRLFDEGFVTADPNLTEYLQALIRAVPRTRKPRKDDDSMTIETRPGFVHPEAEALDTISLAVPIVPPSDPEPLPPEPEQDSMDFPLLN